MRRLWVAELGTDDVPELFVTWPLLSSSWPPRRANDREKATPGTWYHASDPQDAPFVVRATPEQTDSAFLVPAAPVYRIADVQDLFWNEEVPSHAGYLFCASLQLGKLMPAWRTYGEFGQDVLRLIEAAKSLSSSAASEMAAQIARVQPEQLPPSGTWVLAGNEDRGLDLTRGPAGDPVPYGRDELSLHLVEAAETILWQLAAGGPGVQVCAQRVTHEPTGFQSTHRVWGDRHWRPLLIALIEALWAAAIPDLLGPERTRAFAEPWADAFEQATLTATR